MSVTFFQVLVISVNDEIMFEINKSTKENQLDQLTEGEGGLNLNWKLWMHNSDAIMMG